ncbi:hypothetical protein STENM223S_00270 [Streptomyces tendae]
MHPQREHIPLYIAAIGPKNLEQTGEIADGALLIFPSAEHLEETAVKHLRAGREKAGGHAVCREPPPSGENTSASSSSRSVWSSTATSR